MSKDELVAIAKRTAAAHGLASEIVCGQIERESSWQPWMIRYEDAFFRRYIVPMLANGEGKCRLSDLTEARARAFSWGLGQVMGEVARELGYSGPFPALCDPVIGVEWQCRTLAHKVAVHNGNMRNALTSYNGGANAQYAGEVFALAEKYRTS